MAATLLRHWRLDLPVFESDRTLYKAPNLIGVAARNGESTCIRVIGGNLARRPKMILKLGKLTKALAVADEHFGLVAEVVGGSVVDHTWGLYQHRATDLESKRRLPGIWQCQLPEGYILVAEVSTIHEVPGYAFENSAAIRSGILDYLSQSNAKYGYHIGDMTYGQFIGSQVTPDTTEIVLTDIEPRFY